MIESEIRKIVVARVASSSDGHGAAFISELFIDGFARRADLVVANGKLAVFEIKSAHDTLDRLEGQVNSYRRFFEQVTVVCADKHLVSAKAQLPGTVGLWSVSPDGGISVVRNASTKMRLAKSSWLSFLPVDELRLLLREHGEKPAGSRDTLIQRAERLQVQVIRDYTLAFLKRRELRVEAIRKRYADQLTLTRTASVETDALRNVPLERAQVHATATPRRRPS